MPPFSSSIVNATSCRQRNYMKLWGHCFKTKITYFINSFIEQIISKNSNSLIWIKINKICNLISWTTSLFCLWVHPLKFLTQIDQLKNQLHIKKTLSGTIITSNLMAEHDQWDNKHQPSFNKKTWPNSSPDLPGAGQTGQGLRWCIWYNTGMAHLKTESSGAAYKQDLSCIQLCLCTHLFCFEKFRYLIATPQGRRGPFALGQIPGLDHQSVGIHEIRPQTDMIHTQKRPLSQSRQ